MFVCLYRCNYGCIVRRLLEFDALVLPGANLLLVVSCAVYRACLFLLEIELEPHQKESRNPIRYHKIMVLIVGSHQDAFKYKLVHELNVN
jgi:hypothetical protein